VTGERDGQALAACKDVRIHASAEDISKSLSLQGNWRAEHVFALKQALALFDFIGTQLAECNREIKAQLHSLQAHDGVPAKGKKRSNARNAPKFDLRTEPFRVCGVSGETKRCVNRAFQPLRPLLRSTKSALGAYFRRKCSRMDKPEAVTAAAHKLARPIYAMLTRSATVGASCVRCPSAQPSSAYRWC